MDVQGCDVKVTEWSNGFRGSWWVNSMCTTAPTSRLKACFIHTPGQKCKTASAALFLSFPSSFWTWGNCKLHLLGWQGRSMLGLYSVSAREKMKRKGFFFSTSVVDEGKAELGHAVQKRCSPECLCKGLCWMQLWVRGCLWWSTIRRFLLPSVLMCT